MRAKRIEAQQAAGTGASSPAPAPSTTPPNSAENAPFRESAVAADARSERVVAVEFTGANARFRESRSEGRPSPPRKPRNAERRSREYLKPAEVEKLTRAAERLGRHGHR